MFFAFIAFLAFLAFTSFLALKNTMNAQRHEHNGAMNYFYISTSLRYAAATLGFVGTKYNPVPHSNPLTLTKCGTISICQ